MNLTSMKCDADEATETRGAPAYPYGLRIRLDEDQCEALGISKAPAAGSSVTIQAKAIVVSSTQAVESDGDDAGPDIYLELQITDMGVEVGRVMANAASVLYPQG